MAGIYEDIHSMNLVWSQNSLYFECSFLLVDARNDFNELNQTAMLYSSSSGKTIQIYEGCKCILEVNVWMLWQRCNKKQNYRVYQVKTWELTPHTIIKSADYIINLLTHYRELKNFQVQTFQKLMYYCSLSVRSQIKAYTWQSPKIILSL